MSFNSLHFILFLFIVTCIFYNIKSSERQVFFLLLASWIFYTIESIGNLVHLLITTAITISALFLMRNGRERKAVFVGAVSLILVHLLLTKYTPVIFGNYVFGGFSESLMFSSNFAIGISFYCLQAIGLLSDVYSRKFESELNLKKSGLFLGFFPQSLAGPIHRASELIPQFGDRKYFNPDNILVGVKYMLIGYFFKLIIADKISLIISPILDNYQMHAGLPLFVSTILYSFQIYMDFLGYSLIAIGAGRLFGFKIIENFDSPYCAISFRDFWHRWHISLSRWMRDYIYIPLGGSKRLPGYTILVVYFTFLISGIWHGISWTFLLWALFHASLYSIELLLSIKSQSNGRFNNIYLNIFRRIILFLVISLSWLIFRTSDLGDLVGILGKIIFADNWSFASILASFSLGPSLFYFAIIVPVLIVSFNFEWGRHFLEKIPCTRYDVILQTVIVSICAITLFYWGSIGNAEFLYFKF